MKSGKGLKVEFSLTTANAIPAGSEAAWVNIGTGDNSANTFKTKADLGADSGLVSCTGPAGAVS